jgi:glycosyltransferase involved in cell wall biosynthesis
MSEETLQSLPRCAQIWCKTRYAEHIFRERGFDTRFIGFSSKDAYLPGLRKDYGRFLHVSGKSEQKGTGALLELWRRHPEWPPLLVVSQDDAARRFSGGNILVRSDDVPEVELQVLMNVCGVHLCPSEAEGFGHTISEGLSTRALVVSTDAPPMNEVVRPAYGLLAKCHRVLPMSYGERFLVDPEDLERRVATALCMSAAEKAQMGEAARRAYLERDASFAPRLLAVLHDLVAAPRPATAPPLTM